MTASTLLIRTDASVAIGTGHAMRCLALAQAWQDTGGCAVFAMAESTDAIRERLRAESCETIQIASSPGGTDDARETIQAAHRSGATWVVVDGYRFGAEYQVQLKTGGCRVLFLDDYGHAKQYSADLVLNQNIGASESLYSERKTGTRLLLGPRYALLRREFREWIVYEREISPICRQALVLMGGSDPQNLTERVIEALGLAGVDGLETTVVVGGSNPHFPKLQEKAAQSGAKIRFQKDVLRIGPLMADADFAISAAGTTCWELCLLGLPSLVIDVAHNQTAVAEELQRRGCALHVGNCTVTETKLAEGIRSLAGSRELRESLSKRSRELVDGHGANGVVALLRDGRSIWLRRATEQDRELLWEWANDPSVRSASFSTDRITWETHVRWFSQKLNSTQTILLIVEDRCGPVGQVRFEIASRDATINISLSKDKRGSGLGSASIESAVDELFSSTDCERVHALVRPENEASKKTFEKAGFSRSEDSVIRGQRALHFILDRDR